MLAINNITPFSPTVGMLDPALHDSQPREEAVQLTQGDVGKELVENTIRDAGCPHRCLVLCGLPRPLELQEADQDA